MGFGKQGEVVMQRREREGDGTKAEERLVKGWREGKEN